MASIHFIRPFWLLALLPWAWLLWQLTQQKPLIDTWRRVCDEHLLVHLVQTHGRSKRMMSLMALFISLLLMIISLAGPTWSRLPVPIYQKIEPHVVILDMSHEMFLNDMSPSRLDRAKFILHDLFQEPDKGQFGMVVYTSEPFVVSPLTEDSETIDALLSSLTQDVMPVPGHRLDLALQEAGKLITQAGFHEGSLLVLTAHAPTDIAIQTAKTLAKSGINASIISMTKERSPLFQRFALAGHGINIALADANKSLRQWLMKTSSHHMLDTEHNNDIAIWKDEGRWFLIPALILLLPVFRRGWLQRIST